MEHNLKLSDLFGAEIRTRSSAEVLREKMKESTITTFDLDGLSFISRSFADELYILSENTGVKLCNAKGVVKNMLTVVADSRKKKRVRAIDNSPIKEFDNIESLSAFLSTI